MTTTTQTIHDRDYAINTVTYRKHVHSRCQQATRRFRRTLYGRLGLHLFFLAILMTQFALILVWLPQFLESNRLALCLAGLFLTAFSYLAIRVYAQAKKPAQHQEICRFYLRACQRLLHYQEGIPEHHLALANAATRLATRLEGEEARLLTSRKFRHAGSTLERFGTWLYWRDVLDLRRRLFECAAREHIALIKCEPLNLEAHAALANVYVLLSGLYLGPRRDWDIRPAKDQEELALQFRATATRAIEEFKILHAYAPDDPWVHAQLAYSYRDLQMPEEEIREYEILLALRPDDLDTLFKLGMRYFECGQTAKGLEIYEQLKQQHYRGAGELLSFYS